MPSTVPNSRRMDYAGLYLEIDGLIVNGEDVDLGAIGGAVSYNDLTDVPTSFPSTWATVSGKPSFGTASEADVGDFATAAQGSLADSAVQPGDLGDLATLDTVANAQVAASANIALSKLANVASITTAGGTTIPAGTVQETLQAIADLADPAA